MKKSHIIIIGFKNTGKSVVGSALASRINKPFIDLDHVIEKNFEKKHQEKMSCRMIMKKYGEFFFRTLESNALKYSIQQKSSVISLGGGAVLLKENQSLIKSHIVIHLGAPFDEVFHRIIAEGIPSFFEENSNTLQEFKRQWDERQPLYEACRSFDKIMNHQSIEKTVQKIIEQLEKSHEKNSFDAWT